MGKIDFNKIATNPLGLFGKKQGHSSSTPRERCWCAVAGYVCLALFIILPLILRPRILLDAMSTFKPKAVKQASIVLSPDVQAQIKFQAQQEIQQLQANATLAGNAYSIGVSGDSTNALVNTQSSLAQDIFATAQEVFTFDPIKKSKARLKRIEVWTNEVVLLLANNKSPQAVNQAVKIIKRIAEEQQKVSVVAATHKDRELLVLTIEEYMQTQIALQKIEETLPIAQYLVIDGAREKYLVAPVAAVMSKDSNLAATIAIGNTVLEKLVGGDYAELKSIELLADIENSMPLNKRQNLHTLENELALQFQKRMLTLPPSVRLQRLQNYTLYSFGNPLNQIQGFTHMKNFVTDRETILVLDSLKALALSKLTDRVFSLNSTQTLNQFLDSVIQNPAALEILTEMKVGIDNGPDAAKKERLDRMQRSVEERIAHFFGNQSEKSLAEFFAPEQGEATNLSQVIVINNLQAIVNASPNVSAKTKQIFSGLQTQIIQKFVAQIGASGFITLPKLAYNPVGQNADVRILPAAPYAIPVLAGLKRNLPAGQWYLVDRALAAESKIVSENILTQVNNPQIFKSYKKLIDNSSETKQTMQTYVGQPFFTGLSEKSKIIEKAAAQKEQQLYEVIQQLTQHLFLSNENNSALINQGFTQDIASQIQQIQSEIGVREVPKIETPAGVTLPEIASLPAAVEEAIIFASKNQIKNVNGNQDIKIDLSLQAKDLGIGDPTILPGNPLYPFKEILEIVEVAIILNPLDRAEKAIDLANEKTLEAAKLIEQDKSQATIDTALGLLEDVNNTFDKLKAHADDLKTLRQSEPAKVDELVNKIIDNGLARQTVFSSIEDSVYGDSYVKVEDVRQQVLSQGVSTLLKLTDNNTQLLTDKLEQAVTDTQGSRFKEIKAVELLVEIERTQPPAVQKILDTAQESLAQKLEEKLLQIPLQARTDELLSYAQNLPGNPVRQFETYEKLKDGFQNPQDIFLMEGMKDKAVENLADRIEEITDASSLQNFVNQVVGDRPEDLKIITEIEQRVTTPETQVGQELSPVQQKIESIMSQVEENIISTYKDNPQGLLQTELYSDPAHLKTPDVVDIKVTNELTTIFERTPEVEPQVVEATKTLKDTIINQFIENLASPDFAVTTNAAAEAGPNGASVSTSASVDALQVLQPIPEAINELVSLKAQVSASARSQIDAAIKVQVNLIEEHLTTQVTDPQTFETYITQITQDPVVSQVISQVGGVKFEQAIAAKAAEIQVVAEKEQTLLQTTVEAVQKEIFTAPVNHPSEIEQNLPAAVQKQIEEVRHEVPVDQIPQVIVSSEITIYAAPAPENNSGSSQIPVQSTPVQPAAPVQESAPAAPAPQTENAPAAPPPPAVGL